MSNRDTENPATPATELEGEVARLVARVNRMAATAPLADVMWRPAR